ncbi:hypothetical protein [Paenibacillus glacialis]|uniref:Uncharacterized protein n=1 Tax=Paenibacillus glacialis TaxID=494026 RepID=A0A168I4E5_9BACL|nr:hypothetical protein [Paenibacillus glacialis]OAB38855.1 hypothetical protein PGLA_19560 [Paenibacillus glacialis]
MNDKKIKAILKRTLGSNYQISTYKEDVIKSVYRLYGRKDPEGARILINQIRNYKEVGFIHSLILGGAETRSNLQLIDSKTSRIITKQIWDQVGK